jgi:hypothetical protein
MKLTYNEVYEIIKTYYPIGVAETSMEYHQHPGMIRMRELVWSKMNHDGERRKWKDLVSSFEDQAEGTFGVTYEPGLLNYSYSGVVDLFIEEITFGKATRSICCQLSLIGPFYTIYGMDSAEIVLTEHLSAYFEPLIYFSPYSIYEKWFKLIRHKIEEEYHAKFVPYSVLKCRVPSLSIPGAEVRFDKNASVFQALFAIPDITNYRVYGDKSYW